MEGALFYRADADAAAASAADEGLLIGCVVMRRARRSGWDESMMDGYDWRSGFSRNASCEEDNVMLGLRETKDGFSSPLND